MQTLDKQTATAIIEAATRAGMTFGRFAVVFNAVRRSPAAKLHKKYKSAKGWEHSLPWGFKFELGGKVYQCFDAFRGGNKTSNVIIKEVAA
ncbi:hypothetical protein JCM19240_3976 [Vibrio maritimus]|uniref:Uncharacterized protein n=1 Tax=Vibrio maritimus TaxID=990268 RepID=A0A090TEC0_9VIBR|nr:hypothetical protein JCM19240_3976 [Vibrio maritimus]